MELAHPRELARVSLNPPAFDALFELAPDGIFLANLDGRFTHVNAAACRMLDCPREEIVGRTFFDFIASDEAQRLVRTKESMLQGRSERGEWLLRRKDGSWLPVEVHGNILPDGRWQGFARDISERKAQEAERAALFQQIERDRRRLEAVLRTLPLGAVLFDTEGRMTCNPRAEKLLGVTVSGSLRAAQLATCVFYPDGRAVPPEGLPSWRVLERLETITAEEFVVRRPDGAEVPVLAGAAPIFDDQGRLIGGVGVFHDMSERMALERRVRDNARLLKAVFDILPVGVSICDASGRLVDSNPARERIWRGARPVAADADRQYQGWWLDSGRPIAEDEWATARALRNGEASLGELVRIRCFDGSFKTIINSAAPLRDEAGRIMGAVAVIEDVTTLHQTQEQLREAVREREHILAVVAHDLRTPLSSISLRASAVEQKAAKLPGAQDISASAARIGEITSGMAGLVDDLLAISAGRPGRSLLTFAPVAPAEVVAKAVEAAQPLLARAGLELAVAPLAGLPLIHIDQGRILRVFANLFDNAVKFTARGGRIEVGAESAHGAVQFSMANSGSPLGPQEMERLFQPFWQGSQEDARGAGLGLSICRAIIDAHGGSVWTEAAPGMRMKVCFLLPCVSPEAGAPAVTR